MEKDWKRLNPIVFLLWLLLLYLHLHFSLANTDWQQCSSNDGNAIRTTLEVENDEFINVHIAKLVKGEDRKNLDATGFACDKTIHSLVCVSNIPVLIDTTNMTVYIPSSSDHEMSRETVVRPYARQEDLCEAISPVRIIQYGNTTAPRECQYTHQVPALIFSSGSIGNTFHEMNEIIVPLFITTRHFQSRVLLILEDYKQSFVDKYGKILSHLSAYEIMNPALNQSLHCFPGSIVGLKFHDFLAVNSSDIPGEYGTPEFRSFLREAYNLKFVHVSEIKRPRLMLISRTTTRRFLNEEEIILVMKEVGFEVVVVRRSKFNLDKFAQLVNSCSVLVGAHGAGLTNEIFLPSGAVMIQIELVGIEWAQRTYFGETAGGMEVHYLGYKIEAEESSLVKVYGRNHTVITDPVSVYTKGGYSAARRVYLDQQNVRIDIARFRETLVEAYSMVADWDGE